MMVVEKDLVNVLVKSVLKKLKEVLRKEVRKEVLRKEVLRKEVLRKEVLRKIKSNKKCL